MGLKYEPSLDGLRGIAVLAVIAYHSGLSFAAGGYHGVDVFFVLSGYLITSILTKAKPSLSAFWRRRIARLMPALLVMVGGTLALSPLLPAYAPRLGFDAILAATYTMNLVQALGSWTSPLTPTWSLAAEMQFYLIWPFILPALIKRYPVITLLAVYLTLTAVQEAFQSTTQAHVYHFPHMAGLVLGAALVFLPPVNRWFGVLALTVIGVCLVYKKVPVPVAEIATALLILSLRTPSALRDMLAWRPLAWLGLISYGVYLWHFPIRCLFEAHGPIIAGLASLFGGVAAGAASYYLIERRFVVRRSAAIPSPA